MGLRRKLNSAVKGVPPKKSPSSGKRAKDLATRPHMRDNVVDGDSEEKTERERTTPSKGKNGQPTEFKLIEVAGSTGKSYKIAIPKSYADKIPKKWKWTKERYEIAQAIADGWSIADICDDPQFAIKARMTVYAWMEHPEFKEHVNGLILETGFANQSERIAGMQRLQRQLFDKVMKEIDQVKLTDKSVGAVLQSLQKGFEALGKEKNEIIEQSEVKQHTNVSGTVGVVNTKLDDILTSKSEEERKKLESAFDDVGDDIIRGITGEKAQE